MANQILIIGYGNTLRRDDGVGIAVANAFRNRLDTDKIPIHVMTAHQLYPEMVEYIKTATHVFFIDASVEGEAGSFAIQALYPALNNHNKMPFLHRISPLQLLEATWLLYQTKPRATLITIAGEDFGLGEGLSVTVAATVPHAVAHLLKLIESECIIELNNQKTADKHGGMGR